MLCLDGMILETVVYPVGIRILDRIRVILKFLKNGRREECALIGYAIVLLHLIIISSILIGVSQLNHIGRHYHAHRGCGRNVSLTLLTTLGSNEDYTIGTTHTKHGCSRSILQYGDALDFAWVNVVEVTLYTIHLNQWRRIVGSSLTTYQDSCSISSRLTGILY